MSTTRLCRMSSVVLTALIGSCLLVSATSSALACLTKFGLVGRERVLNPKEGETALVGIVERVGPPVSGQLRAEWELMMNHLVGINPLSKQALYQHPGLTLTVRPTRVIAGEVPQIVLIELNDCTFLEHWVGDEIAVVGKLDRRLLSLWPLRE